MSAHPPSLLMVLMVTVLADLIIYFALQAFIQKILVNKIIRISNETVRFSKENTISENNLVDILKTLDEIGYLADSVTDMEHQIVNHIKNITAITAEKERAETQLKIAAAIQLGALPKPIALGSIDLYATMQPAFEVGGDFYDFFKIDDKHIVFDFNQNMAGWAKISLKGERGSKVTLVYAEGLKEDNHVNQLNLRSARCSDTYILKGEGIETYSPRFTYHGFQFVEAIIEGKVEIISIK